MEVSWGTYFIEGSCGLDSLVIRRMWPPSVFTLFMEAVATSSLVIYLEQIDVKYVFLI